MLSYYINNNDVSNNNYAKAMAYLDEAFHTVTIYAFSTPYNLDKIQLGMDAIQLYLHPEKHVTSSSSIQPSFQYEITRGTWLKALRALTSSSINSSRPIIITSLLSYNNGVGNNSNNNNTCITPADAAFRILQRFITGRGVRCRHQSSKQTNRNNYSQAVGIKKKEQKGQKKNQYRNNNNMSNTRLDERDFNMVLHAYAFTHQMQSAHRVLALQEQLRPRSPPLSPVAYSILLKAYGQKGDVKNVEICIHHAQRNRVQPDIVMGNTVLDAYVNCGLVDKAEMLFDSLSVDDGVKNNASEDHEEDNDI
eukprot:scaffold19202_cov43-Cyclotella_meneghiniana.AAC.1